MSVCFVCGSSGQDCSWLLGPRNSPSRQMTDWWLYIVVITSELVILPTDWPASSVTINRNRKTSSISQPAAAGPGRVSRLTTQEIGTPVFAIDKTSSTSDIVKMILRNFKFSLTHPLKTKNSSESCSLQEWKSRQLKPAILHSKANSTYLSTSILLFLFFFSFYWTFITLHFNLNAVPYFKHPSIIVINNQMQVTPSNRQ